MIWLLFACSSAEYATKATTEDMDMMADTGYVAPPEDNEGTAEEMDAVTPAWWRLFANISMLEQQLDPATSSVQVYVYDESLNAICAQNYEITESVPSEPVFSGGLLWWRIQLAPVNASISEETNSDDVDVNQLAPSTVGCDTEPNISTEFEIGVGELHVESLAVWDSIDWLDIESPNDNEPLFSSYLSQRASDDVWVFGAAISSLNETSQEYTIDEYLLLDQVWYLRPAYVFPLE